MDVMEKSLLESSVFEDIPKEDIAKGVDLLRSRFSKKIEPICSKLEVCIIFQFSREINTLKHIKERWNS